MKRFFIIYRRALALLALAAILYALILLAVDLFASCGGIGAIAARLLTS